MNPLTHGNLRHKLSRWNLLSIRFVLLSFLFLSLYSTETLCFPFPANNHFQKGEKLDLRFYISDRRNFQISNKSNSAVMDSGILIWHEVGLVFDNSLSTELSNAKNYNTTIELTKSMQNNGNIYGHALLTRSGLFPDFRNSIYVSELINIYLPRATVKSERFLLFDPPPSLEEIQRSKIIVSFWRVKLSIHLVSDFLKEKSDAFLYLNVINIAQQTLLPINETISNLPLEIQYSPMEIDRFQWYKQLELTFQIHKESFGSSFNEIENFKSMFLETNPSLLYVTAVVSFFHLLFDFLAFKNDVSFWRKVRSFKGLSLRTLFINVCSQFIILLYLLENETSSLVIASLLIGLIIETWKIFRTFSFSTSFRYRFIPIIHLYSHQDYLVSSTNEFDRQAINALALLMMPAIVFYSIYSLIYYKHTGWYAWFLSSLVSMVYTFGFARMTPQLFINYKLKSVAHLPWRVFTYKAINTFIDDLFAFIIKMPTMHRLSCFRDDVIFLIYLYQRWIYPVDKSRTDEDPKKD